MKILKTVFFKKRLRTKYSKNTLKDIMKILTEYSHKQISIVECVSIAGPLTVELFFMYSSEKTNKSVFYTILVMITNYYIMMYLEMYTGFYAVSRKHTCNMVTSMVEEVLEETAKKQKGLNSNDLQMAIHKSRYFTRQMVEVYYNAGLEDCHRYVVSAVFLEFQSGNKNSSVKREWVENILRATQAEKFITASCEDAECSL